MDSNARNSRGFRAPPAPSAQSGASKTVYATDVESTTASPAPKKRRPCRRLCRCNMFTSSEEKRSPLPRRIAIATLALITLCGLVLGIVWAAMDQVCDSPACIIAAARTISLMGQSVNPCDDFYEFACRGMQQNSSSLRESMFNPLISTLNADYDRILTGQIHPTMDTTLDGLYDEMKRIHKSCMEGTLNDTYAPFESIFPEGDAKHAIENGQKFVAIFWDLEWLIEGFLFPAPPENILGRPWESIYDEFVTTESTEEAPVSFTGQQLNIALPHLANWTSVIDDSLHTNIPIHIFCFSYFKALDDYIASNPPGLYQNITQMVELAMEQFVSDNEIHTAANEQQVLRECRELIRRTHGGMLLHIWLLHRFKSSQAEAAQKMAMNLRTALEKRITENEWLDEVSKLSINKRLMNMTFSIGEGPNQFSTDVLLRHYSTPKTLPDIYKILKLWLSNGGPSWDISLITTVNAFYSFDDHLLKIPFTLLREPLLTLETPVSMQYGSIGVIIGHEITHAFDNVDDLSAILSRESLEKMNSSATCFADTYSRYSEAYTTVDGRLTLPENIADNGGLQSSWRAYQSEKAARGPFQKRVRLPSLPFSDDQLFFISFAQTFCSARSAKSIRNQILTDSHTPDKTRVNVGLSLFEPFAQSFKCPVSSSMNPTSRCRMWKRGVSIPKSQMST